MFGIGGFRKVRFVSCFPFMITSLHIMLKYYLWSQTYERFYGGKLFVIASGLHDALAVIKR